MENTKLLTEAQLEAIEKLSEVVKEIVDKLVEIIKKAAEQVMILWRAVIKNYHNKRVVHLALHSKDLRVRKKNTNRIMKWLRRWITCRE